jgi:hypothetical protein
MPYTTIDKGSSYFNTVTYTGTGASNARTGVGFKPDWVWIKGRSGATDHGIYDAVRGVQKQLESNTTTAETTETTGLTAFGSDGFTVGALAQLNTSSATYVAWNWLGANTTVSNTSGTITSTVSANTTSGFSIVTRTGTGSLGTVGHGLGVAPKMIITKKRSAVDAWGVYHASLGATKFLILNTTASEGTSGAPFNNTEPTSSVFTVNTRAGFNGSGETFVDYCFAEVKGYSKFGSYTGNGSTDGTFVYTGFKPAFIMVKRTDSTYSWYIFDNKRSGYNVDNDSLSPDLATEEFDGQTYAFIDLLSNGFKMRDTFAGRNGSGGTFIYMAFADSPFVSSKSIPTTAR